MNDEYYMRKALALARKGLGKTSPNPIVGAVIVKRGKIIGQGYHRCFGGPHAEIEAINDAKGNINGATLYVTLEPCCHVGKKTPPCLDTVLKYDLKRVVIGTIDPNPQVNGISVKALKKKGIETKVGVLEEECRKLNEAYFKYIQTGMPFVTLKFAQTLDGRIATLTGDSKWISSEKSLEWAHRLRSQHDAVMVGVGTVLKDDPQLTVRLTRGRNPVRVVADSRLRTPLGAQILKKQEIAPTIIATTKRADLEKQIAIKALGVEVLVLPEDREGEVNLSELLRSLGQRNISSILVEGGATTITSFVRQGLVDKLVIIIAPKILGKGLETVGDLGIREVSRSFKLTFDKAYRKGEDLVIEAKV
ncbi:MAG TPA: bifunctional diaminohydroxyphosphoribosylaminopyrimidine deaminase/5-amino-6-(5-phosphoribosylamino)uracil reductase RibD [Dehalococcoidia bacterium]|nr:bifunctional diaminohydroxyphosphoribosylaminopyrimidine deaminase/5-amino-6-(5-phosphoribosylamino)uracil reductase RibD [Dehalococcoidia bacterium]